MDPIGTLERTCLKLTKRLIDQTPCPLTGERVLWETSLPGFGVRIYASGRRVFFVRYRTARSRRRYILGLVGTLTVEQARTRAQDILARVRQGEDPAAVRQQARGAPTVAELATKYLAEHGPKKKASSVRMDESNLRLHILPALGQLPVASVGPHDISRLHTRLHATPIAANRCLALLSTMFRLAEQWGWRPRASTPTYGVTRYREVRRERFLSLEDVARLGIVLAEAAAQRVEMPSVLFCIQLLILTGGRLEEVLHLRWRDIDTARRVAWLPDSKTGARPLFLSPEALALLATIPTGSPWVLPGRSNGHPLSPPHRPWYRLRDKAQLGDLRLHDLRHTYASLLVQSGQSLPTIGALLGHRHVRTTQRYAHFSADPLHQAAAQIGSVLGPLLLRHTS